MDPFSRDVFCAQFRHFLAVVNQILTVLQYQLLGYFLNILIDIQVHHVVDFCLFLVDIDIFRSFNDLGVHGFQINIKYFILSDNVYLNLFEIICFNRFLPLRQPEYIFLRLQAVGKLAEKSK